MVSMKKNDPTGTYEVWANDRVSYQIPDTDIPGKELWGYFVGCGCTKHFQKHARKVAGINGCHVYAVFDGILSKTRQWQS